MDYHYRYPVDYHYRYPQWIDEIMKVKLKRYALDTYLDGVIDKRFYFSRLHDVMWATRMIKLVGPRASCRAYDRWRGCEITLV